MGVKIGGIGDGPLELAGPQLTAIVIEGEASTATLSRGLAEVLATAGSRTAWIGGSAPRGAVPMPSPVGYGIWTRLGEIVPFQLAAVALARQMGFEPGEFVHSSKVTLGE